MGRLPIDSVRLMNINNLTTDDRTKPRVVSIDDSDINWEGKIKKEEEKQKKK